MKNLKKVLVLIQFILVSQSCSSQRLNEYQIEKIKDRDLFVKEISDNLNTYDDKDCKIPSFFIDKDYDRLIGSKFWLSMHATVSIRKLIIDKINNTHLLECIINSNNQLIKDNIPIPKNASYTYNRIPYQEYSTYELVKLRIEELENIQKLGKN